MDQPDLRAPDVRQPAWWRLCLASPEELAMMASLDGLRLHCDAAAAAAAARCKAWQMSGSAREAEGLTPAGAE
ncbi:hypothetical protein [Xanthomonas axonopodis]|uniref:hypothetical protein n=1 Tax=Xanthomonas axonopodis TaxID=53413 RepID=UPI0035573C83